MADETVQDGDRSVSSSQWQDLLRAALHRVTAGGKSGLKSVSQAGKSQIETRQNRRELEHYWIRLGKTAFHLTEAGELDHPALHKAIERVKSLQERIAHPNTTSGEPTK
jgi:hypothetical protein